MINLRDQKPVLGVRKERKIEWMRKREKIVMNER